MRDVGRPASCPSLFWSRACSCSYADGAADRAALGGSRFVRRAAKPKIDWWQAPLKTLAQATMVSRSHIVVGLTARAASRTRRQRVRSVGWPAIPASTSTSRQPVRHGSTPSRACLPLDEAAPEARRLSFRYRSEPGYPELPQRPQCRPEALLLDRPPIPSSANTSTENVSWNHSTRAARARQLHSAPLIGLQGSGRRSTRPGSPAGCTRTPIPARTRWHAPDRVAVSGLFVSLAGRMHDGSCSTCSRPRIHRRPRKNWHASMCSVQ